MVLGWALGQVGVKCEFSVFKVETGAELGWVGLGCGYARSNLQAQLGSRPCRSLVLRTVPQQSPAHAKLSSPFAVICNAQRQSSKSHEGVPSCRALTPMPVPAKPRAGHSGTKPGRPLHSAWVGVDQGPQKQRWVSFRCPFH